MHLDGLKTFLSDYIIRRRRAQLESHIVVTQDDRHLLLLLLLLARTLSGVFVNHIGK